MGEGGPAREVHSFASVVIRRRPDFARLRRGQPSVFFTSRPGAPKRSDGGLVPESYQITIQLLEQHVSV
jgi:hypothetical protein